MIRSRRKRRQSVDPACGSYAGKHKSVATSTTGQCRERAALPHSAQCQLRSQQRIPCQQQGLQCSARFQVRTHSGEQVSVPNIPAPQPAISTSGRGRAAPCLASAQATPRAALLASPQRELRQSPGLGHMEKVALMKFSDRASETCM